MFRRIITMLAGLAAAGGCSTSSNRPLPLKRPGAFVLTEVASTDTPEGTLKTWRASSGSNDGLPFHFRLEMLLKSPTGDSPFAFGKGAIVREPGEDGTRFLNEVAQAIETGSPVPTRAERLDRLEFSTAILGTSLSRESGSNILAGSFTSSKPGNWIAFKVFLADGEAEVYLNLNLVAGEGEFSTKDPEYGEVVLRELASVFLP